VKWDDRINKILTCTFKGETCDSETLKLAMKALPCHVRKSFTQKYLIANVPENTRLTQSTKEQ